MNLSDWIGRIETLTDTATPTPYAALSAVLDGPTRTPSRRNAFASALALAVFPATSPAIGDRTRWACEAGQFSASRAAAPPDVGGKSVPLS